MTRHPLPPTNLTNPTLFMPPKTLTHARTLSTSIYKHRLAFPFLHQTSNYRAAMDWIRGPAIGRGSTATVSLAASSSSGHLFAVKSAPLSRSKPLQSERVTLSRLSSPYLVGYRGFEIGRCNSEDLYSIFMEYVPGGTLADVAGRIDEPTIGLYTWRILMGLEYLHSVGVVHCDIKPCNVLIGPDGPKIADLGCSRPVPDSHSGPPEIAGTPMYMAPEAARGEQQGCAADVWSLGCTVAEMATGRPPWEGTSGELVAAVYRIGYSEESPEIPIWLSEEARDFIGKCLRRNPAERWTVGELLRHPFIEKHSADDGGMRKWLFSSPTSTLEQGIWSVLEESTTSSPTSTTTSYQSFGISLEERMRGLRTVSGEPSWELEENWTMVRTGEMVKL